MTELRYIGGLPSIALVFASGRTLVVNRGETLELLPIEAEALAERTDFAPADSPPPPVKKRLTRKDEATSPDSEEE